MDSVLASTVLICPGLARAQAPTACPTDYTCSYQSSSTGALVGGKTDGQPQSRVGFLTFDAAGNWSGVLSGNINGTVVSNGALSGTCVWAPIPPGHAQLQSGTGWKSRRPCLRNHTKWHAYRSAACGIDAVQRPPGDSRSMSRQLGRSFHTALAGCGKSLRSLLPLSYLPLVRGKIKEGSHPFGCAQDKLLRRVLLPSGITPWLGTLFSAPC